MNPLVEKMLIAQREGIDVRTVEQIFEHRAECQSDHAYNGDTCSADVTAKISRNCGGHKIVCHNAEVAAEEAIVMQTFDCGYCEDHIENCWTIHPI